MTIGLPLPETETTRLILLRHGEPDAVVRGRCYGRLDPGLSPRGRAQMRNIWLQLDHQPLSATYSSPARRAVESASLRGSAVPALRIDEGLCEIDFGEFEGLAYCEIEKRYPDTYSEWMTRPTDVTFPGGESFAAMAVRVRDALDRIRAAHAGETVAIVSHGGVNRIALAAALDLEPRRIFRLAQAYACINVIDYVGAEPLIRLVNGTLSEARNDEGNNRV
jgi:alpha-ribazole phosphatase